MGLFLSFACSFFVYEGYLTYFQGPLDVFFKATWLIFGFYVCMFVHAGPFDVCIYMFIGFSCVCMYMFIGLFYVRENMYIGLFSVCRICEEKNSRQRELQRKVMTE